MAEGPRTLENAERRVLREALMRQLAEAYNLRALWNNGGSIAKVLKLTAAQIDSHIHELDRLIGIYGLLATELVDDRYEIIIAAKATTP